MQRWTTELECGGRVQRTNLKDGKQGNPKWSQRSWWTSEEFEAGEAEIDFTAVGGHEGKMHGLESHPGKHGGGEAVVRAMS